MMISDVCMMLLLLYVEHDHSGLPESTDPGVFRGGKN